MEKPLRYADRSDFRETLNKPHYASLRRFEQDVLVFGVEDITSLLKGNPTAREAYEKFYESKVLETALLKYIERIWNKKQSTSPMVTNTEETLEKATEKSLAAMEPDVDLYEGRQKAQDEYDRVQLEIHERLEQDSRFADAYRSITWRFGKAVRDQHLSDYVHRMNNTPESILYYENQLMSGISKEMARWDKEQSSAQ